MTKKIKIKTKHILISIIIFAFFTRVYRISIPEKYYFDEVYHAYTAKAYAKNDPRGYEWWNPADEEGTAFEWLHPPISKLFMAGSIKIFGENSFAWRFPSAIFGTLVIYLTFVLAKNIFKNDSIALLSAFLSSTDGLLLTQSRIAMNDIYLVAFILLTLIYYQKFNTSKDNKSLILTSIFLGLSISTKWTGVFLIPIIGFIEGIKFATKNKSIKIKYIVKLILATTFIPFCIYILSYTQFFLQGHSIDQFVELHNQIIRYEFGLDATHPYQSKAWQWPIVARPIWYHVDYSNPPKMGNIYAMSNPIISWFGLFALIWFVGQIIKKKKFRSPSYLLLTTSYMLLWIPWLASPRIMFYYHYAPAIPFLAIFISAFISSRKKSSRESWILWFTTLALVSFVLLYPRWTGLPMSSKYHDLITIFPSWK